MRRNASPGSDVCVVVPTLAREEVWLRQSLSSIRSQGEVAHLRIVAPDSSRVRSIAAEFSAELLVEQGRGLSAALNQGFSGLPERIEFLSWLGDDDLLAPDSLVRARQALLDDPDAPFVFGRVRYIEPDGRSKWLLRPGRWAVPYGHWGHNFIAQQGGLMRRSCFEQVGGIDESLLNSMDQDLFLKLARLGSPAYLPIELGAWRIQPASISSTKGAADESKLVMRRFRPSLPDPIDWLVTQLVRVSDRVLLSTHCRIPGPPPPLVDGLPYTVA